LLPPQPHRFHLCRHHCHRAHRRGLRSIVAHRRRLALPLSSNCRLAMKEEQKLLSQIAASEGPSERKGLIADVRPDVVVFKNVTKKFGEGADAKVAIQDISFVVEDLPKIGELVTIVGPSGCGKSTLLRTIAALKPHFPPTKGEVLVF